MDTYLYLREGAGRDGSVLHENDDIVSGNTNSEIQEDALSGNVHDRGNDLRRPARTGDFYANRERIACCC